MSRKTIHIERLEIRLPKGASASAARQMASGLGGEILNQLADNASKKTGVQQIAKIDAGKIKNGAEMPAQIARRIAAMVGRNTK